MCRYFKKMMVSSAETTSLMTLATLLILAVNCGSSHAVEETNPKVLQIKADVVEVLLRSRPETPLEVRPRLDEFDLLPVLLQTLRNERNSRLLERDTVHIHTKLELMIIDAILSFREKMSQPQPGLGLPILDPYIYGNIPLAYNNESLSLTGKLELLSVSGLSTFELVKFKLYLVQYLGVTEMMLPSLNLQVRVQIDTGSWFSPLRIPVQGNAFLNFTVGPVKASVRATVAIENERLRMDSLDMAYDLGNVDIQLRGIFMDNPHLTEVAAKVVSELLPRLAEWWRPAIEKQAAMLLDHELKNLQIEDVIDMIKPKPTTAPTL